MTALPKPKRQPKERKRLRRNTKPIARRSRPRAQRRTAHAALVREADRLCREIVLRRDGTCQVGELCGSNPALDWCHGFPRSTYPALRHEPRAHFAACRDCHRWVDKSKARREWFMSQRLGLAGVAELIAVKSAPPIEDVLERLRGRVVEGVNG